MRALKISGVFLKYLVFYRFTPYRKENFGLRLRRACEELGIIFIKIGQMLSTRHDVLPEIYCQELQQLLNSANPIPFAVISRILDAEYGPRFPQIFKSFSEKPLGSASVSQVHKAELLDGTLVAVKIKRPNVDRWFAADIKVLRAVARVGWLFSLKLRRARILELVDFFGDWIRQDLDFKSEVENINKVRKQYDFAVQGFRNDLGRAILVGTHNELCTENIIVMDFVEGIPLNRKAEILADKRYDPRKSIKSYASSAVRNWFRDDLDVYYFQADPHLSNLLALPGGDAASIDHGLLGRLTREEGKISRELLIAVYLQDIDRVLRIVAQLVDAKEEDVEVLRPNLEKYLRQAQQEGFGFWFVELGRIIIGHGFNFPSFLVTLGRAQLMIDGMIHEYMPEQNTIDILGEELRRAALREVLHGFANVNLVKLSYLISKRIQEAPKLMEQILNKPLQEIISEALKAVRAAA